MPWVCLVISTSERLFFDRCAVACGFVRSVSKSGADIRHTQAVGLICSLQLALTVFSMPLR